MQRGATLYDFKDYKSSQIRISPLTIANIYSSSAKTVFLNPKLYFQMIKLKSRKAEL